MHTVYVCMTARLLEEVGRPDDLTPIVDREGCRVATAGQDAEVRDDAVGEEERMVLCGRLTDAVARSDDVSSIVDSVRGAHRSAWKHAEVLHHTSADHERLRRCVKLARPARDVAAGVDRVRLAGFKRRTAQGAEILERPVSAWGWGVQRVVRFPMVTNDQPGIVDREAIEPLDTQVNLVDNSAEIAQLVGRVCGQRGSRHEKESETH